MAETALLEQETSTEEEAAPLAETAAETPEEETSESTAETESLTREEHELLLQTALDNAKAEQERTARAQADEAAVKNHQANYQAWENWGRAQAIPFLENLAKWAHKEGEEGRDLRLNPKVVENLSVQLGQAIVSQQFGRFDQTTLDVIKERYGDIDADALKKRDIGVATGDVKVAIHALLDMAESAMTEKAMKAAEKRFEEKQKSAEETKKIKQQDAAARANGKPTRGTPSAGSSWTQAKLDALPQSELTRMAREGTLAAAIEEAEKGRG